MEWYLDVPGSQLSVEYVDVQDSDATPTLGGIISASSTDSGNNTNWFFGSIGVEWNATDWTTYDTITIKHENIDESLRDFPVYVDLGDLSPSFWATTPSESFLVGTDIRVTTEDGTPVELPRELVAASSTAQTGELHFKADFINKDADTSFRIYYNGTTTGGYVPDATYGAQGVWNSNYKSVYHLEEDPTSTMVFDSTANDNDLTPNGSFVSEDSVAGVVGQSVQFDGNDETFIDIDQVWENAENTPTIQFWNNVTAAAAAETGTNAFAWNAVGGERMSSHAPRDNEIYWDFGTCCDTGRLLGSYTAYVDKWTMVHLTNGLSQQAIYLDGASQYTSGTVDNPNVDLTGFYLGSAGGVSPHDGIIDEFRVSTVELSPAWIRAEYVNQSTTTDFYFLGVGTSGTGSTTLGDHTATQVDNAFSFQNKTNEPLFAFQFTPQSGSSTITELTLEVRGAKDINVNDFSNIRLLRDHDNDAQYDASDQEVATGAFTLGNRGRNQNTTQIGTIIFNDDFVSTTTQNYLIVADWNYPARSSALTIDLYPEDIIASDSSGAHVFLGSVDDVQHERRTSFSGGGGGSSAAVGTPAPAGDGDVGGGGSDGGGAIDTNTGGNTIGNQPDFKWPTAGSGDWQSIANAYDQVDGTYATTSVASSSDLTTFNDAVPGSDTIEGIVVKLEGSQTGTGQIAAELSFDGGSTYTSSGNVTSGLGATDSVVTLGGPSDLWGRSWSPGEFSNANFRVRITGDSIGGGDEVRLDAIQVRVYHQATGGSSGGGGAI